MDIVHVKWANCPTGDYNHAMGKEGFPSLAFECITDYNLKVLGVYGPLFRSRNDKDIVKTDVNVNAIQSNELFRDSQWRYYQEAGRIRTDKGLVGNSDFWFQFLGPPLEAGFQFCFRFQESWLDLFFKNSAVEKSSNQNFNSDIGNSRFCHVGTQYISFCTHRPSSRQNYIYMLYL
jgi:hypothetical protein